MRKINWGVLGTAYIAEKHTIPGMQMACNANLTAIASRDIKKAEDFKERFGFEKAYGNYEDLLNDKDIEAVYIPLPNHLHKEWSIKAMEAGKHVLCEKPMAMNSEDLEELYAVADKCGVVLMEAYAYLHSPVVAAIKEELDNKAIGDILYMESAFITCNHSDSNFRMHKDAFGGGVYDLGCYNVSQALWLLGEEPNSVKAIGQFTEEGIDSLAAGLLGYESGKKVAFTCGMVLEVDGHKRIDRLDIQGTKGYIRSRAEYNGMGCLQYELVKDGVKEVKSIEVPHNYMLEVEKFGRCVTEGEELLVTRDFSRKVIKILNKVLDEIGY